MSRKKRRRRWPYFLLGLLLLLIVGNIVARQMGWIGRKELPKVAAENIELRTIIETVSASGKVYPAVEVSMTPDVSGELTQLLVKEGDSVRAGQLLARINPDIYASMVDRAEAAVNSAKANKANAESRITQAEARASQFSSRTIQADARVTQAQTRIKQNDTRLEQFSTRLAQVDTRMAQIQTREKQLDSRIIQAEARKKQIDARKQQSAARIDQFKARSAQLLARIENTQETHERNQQLFKDGIISQVDLDNSELALKNIQEDKKAQEAELKGLEADLQSIDAELQSADADVKSLEAEKQGLKTEIQGMEVEKQGIEIEKQGVIAEKQGLEADVLSVQADREALDSDKVSLDAEVTAAQKTVEGAGFNVKSSQASLKEAKDNLKRTNIYAPISGIISRLAVEKGERVVGTTQMAGTEMMRIADFSDMETQVDVSENDILRVNVGDTAIVEIDAYLDRKFKGIVTEIANSAANTGGLAAASDQITNFTVTIRLLKASYKDLLREIRFPFRPGMSASVDIQTQTQQNVVAVPIQAVTTREIEANNKRPDKEAPLEEIVFIVDKEDQVFKKKVKVGIQDDNYIAITKGLKKGEKVITAPYSAISESLKDSLKVKVVSKKELYQKK